MNVSIFKSKSKHKYLGKYISRFSRFVWSRKFISGKLFHFPIFKFISYNLRIFWLEKVSPIKVWCSTKRNHSRLIFYDFTHILRTASFNITFKRFLCAKREPWKRCSVFLGQQTTTTECYWIKVVISCCSLEFSYFISVDPFPIRELENKKKKDSSR